MDLSQAELAARAGLTQSMVSRLERGLGAMATIETWATLAAGAGHRLAVFMERTSGTDRPREFEHLRRQQLVLETPRPGPWTARLEASLDPGVARSRSVDVLLTRMRTHEVAIVEVWDWLDDVGAAVRSSDAKVETVRSRLAAKGPSTPPWTVAELWILRGTRRNRALVASFDSVFASRFPEPSGAWLMALAQPEARMPPRPGLLWTDVTGTSLLSRRFLSQRTRATRQRNGPTG